MSLECVLTEEIRKACADPEGGGIGCPDPPPIITKAIGLLSNTSPDPLKNYKAAKPAFNVGPLSAVESVSV